MAEITFSVDKLNFEKQKEKALKRAEEVQYNNERSTFLWSNDTLELDELGFNPDTGDLLVSFSLPEEVGYISVNIPIDIVTIISMIEYYTKRANKIKTLLEAAK